MAIKKPLVLRADGGTGQIQTGDLISKDVVEGLPELIAGKENTGVAAGLIAAAIGVSVQAYHATLTALAGVVTTAFGRGLLALADVAALRALLAMPVATTAGRLARYTDAAGTLGETAGLHWDAVNSRLGIGTVGPSVPLHIVGSAGFISARFKGQYAAVGVLTGDTNTVGIGLDNGSDGYANGFFVGPGYVRASTGSTERFRADATGFGIGTTAPTASLDNAGDTYRQRLSRTPASASAAGNAGDFCWDANFFYICIATNSWRRVAHATW